MKFLVLFLVHCLLIAYSFQQEENPTEENPTEENEEEGSDEEGLPSSDVNLVAFYLYPSVE